MKKGTIQAILIMVAFVIIGFGFTYVKNYAAQDVNTWICKTATEMGVPKAMHPHFKDQNGKSFTCI